MRLCFPKRRQGTPQSCSLLVCRANRENEGAFASNHLEPVLPGRAYRSICLGCGMSISRSGECSERLWTVGAVWGGRWNRVHRKAWNSLWNIRYMMYGKAPFRGNLQGLSSWARWVGGLCTGQGSLSPSGFRRRIGLTNRYWTRNVSRWEGYPLCVGLWVSWDS